MCDCDMSFLLSSCHTECLVLLWRFNCVCIFIWIFKIFTFNACNTNNSWTPSTKLILWKIVCCACVRRKLNMFVLSFLGFFPQLPHISGMFVYIRLLLPENEFSSGSFMLRYIVYHSRAHSLLHKPYFSNFIRRCAFLGRKLNCRATFT